MLPRDQAAPAPALAVPASAIDPRLQKRTANKRGWAKGEAAATLPRVPHTSTRTLGRREAPREVGPSKGAVLQTRGPGSETDVYQEVDGSCLVPDGSMTGMGLGARGQRAWAYSGSTETGGRRATRRDPGCAAGGSRGGGSWAQPQPWPARCPLPTQAEEPGQGPEALCLLTGPGVSLGLTLARPHGPWSREAGACRCRPAAGCGHGSGGAAWAAACENGQIPSLSAQLYLQTPTIF